MTLKNTLLALVVTACSPFSTVLSQTQDTLVEVELSRLRRWAATRLVSDTLLSELAVYIARKDKIIIQFEAASVKADTIIERQAREIQGWKDKYQEAVDSSQHWQKKYKRANTERWLWRGYVVVREGLRLIGF